MPVNIANLEEALADVDALLVLREQQLETLKAEVDELRIERAGLERAVARRRASTPAAELPTPTASQVSQVGETVVVVNTGDG